MTLDEVDQKLPQSVDLRVAEAAPQLLLHLPALPEGSLADSLPRRAPGPPRPAERAPPPPPHLPPPREGSLADSFPRRTQVQPLLAAVTRQVRALQEAQRDHV